MSNLDKCYVKNKTSWCNGKGKMIRAGFSLWRWQMNWLQLYNYIMRWKPGISTNKVLHLAEHVQGPETGAAWRFPNSRRRHPGSMMREENSGQREGLGLQEPNPWVVKDAKESRLFKWLGTCTVYFEGGEEWVAGISDVLFVNGKIKKFLCFQLKYEVTSSNESEASNKRH